MPRHNPKHADDGARDAKRAKEREERREFACSHGYEPGAARASYAECVQEARRERIRRILEDDRD